MKIGKCRTPERVVSSFFIEYSFTRLKLITIFIIVQLEPLNFVYSFRLFPDDQLFDLRNVHLHWNKSDHFIDGEKFEGDIHAVFQSRNFPSRFSVVGFMLDVKKFIILSIKLF